VVVVVGEEPEVDAGRAPDARPGWGRRATVVAVAVLAVAMGGLALVEARVGDPAEGDAAATPTTERRRPTSTTLLPASEPDPPRILPGSTGLRVVTLGPRISMTDLDTGEVTLVGNFGNPAFSFSAGVARDRGLVIIANDGVLYIPDLVPDATSVNLGDGNQVLASDHADRVWIVVDPRAGGLGFVPLASTAASSTATEVDLTGGVTAGPITLPAGVTPVDGVPGGLLVDTPDGIFLIDRDGDARRVARGTPIDTFGANLVHHVCDVNMRCGLQVTDVATGEQRRIEGVRDLAADFFGSAGLSPDGRLLALETYVEGQSPGMDVIDLTTGTVVRSDDFLSNGVAAWSPDGRWLIRAGFSGGFGAREGYAIDMERGEIFELNLPSGDNGILVLAPAEE
jgi:hypothetical protein